jgi:selenocysteine lyase/cysteine desulfurase
MIYFDNAATSFPKPKKVVEAVTDCLANYCANPGRSGHQLALRAGRAVYDTREGPG